jgi:hypothetical protein
MPRRFSSRRARTILPRIRQAGRSIPPAACGWVTVGRRDPIPRTRVPRYDPSGRREDPPLRTPWYFVGVGLHTITRITTAMCLCARRRSSHAILTHPLFQTRTLPHSLTCIPPRSYGHGEIGMDPHEPEPPVPHHPRAHPHHGANGSLRERARRTHSSAAPKFIPPCPYDPAAY